MPQVNTQSNNSNEREEQPTDIDAVINSFIDSTTALAHALDAPEGIVKEFVDSAEALGSLVKESAEKANQAGQKTADNSDEIQCNSNDIQKLQNHSGQDRAELKSRVSSVEEELDEIDTSACSECGGTGSSEQNPHPSSEETTPLEQVCALPQETSEKNLTANQSRARFIAKGISDYGRKVPAGTAIKSSEIRKVLSASVGESIHTETVRRVMDFLDRLGENKVQLKKTRSNEKVVVFTEKIVENLATMCVVEGGGSSLIRATI